MPRTQRVRVGIIGVGAIGKYHAESLAMRIPEADLIGIADANLEAARNVASALGVKEVFQDYRQLLARNDFEAVVVAVPTFLKLEMLLAAAEAGKHIFCEKPLALNTKQADQVVAAAQRSSVKFQVGYQRRFDASFVRAKNAVSSGEVGRILMVTSRTRDPPQNISGWSADPSKSGSIFLDTCSHDFDLIRWLTGSEVTRVFAEGVALVHEELGRNGDYDNVVVTLKLSDGAVGHVDSCGHTVYGYDTAAEVLGTEGAVLVSVGDKTYTHLSKRDTVSNEFQNTFIGRYGQAYRDELADFLACIVEDREPRVTATDGRAAVAIGVAAWESAKESRPISL